MQADPVKQLDICKKYCKSIDSIFWGDECCICHEKWINTPVEMPTKGHLANKLVCKRCREEKTVGARSTLPIHSYSKEAGMDPGRDVPECLSRLRLVERLLIARIIPSVQVSTHF